MIIRPISITDTLAIVEMGESMHHESAYRHLDYRYDKCMDLCMFVMENPDAQLGIVAVEGAEIIGMFGGYVVPYFFGADLVAMDWLLYVKPEHRGGSAAVKLLRHYEAWAREKGAKQAVLGISTEIATDRTLQFYERMGFRRIGHALRKEL